MFDALKSKRGGATEEAKLNDHANKLLRQIEGTIEVRPDEWMLLATS
jgi:hypothetical protein